MNRRNLQDRRNRPDQPDRLDQLDQLDRLDLLSPTEGRRQGNGPARDRLMFSRLRGRAGGMERGLDGSIPGISCLPDLRSKNSIERGRRSVF